MVRFGVNGAGWKINSALGEIMKIGSPGRANAYKDQKMNWD